MLDRQRKIVQSTVPVLQEHGETITRVFYRRLLEEHPELASMFSARDQSDGSQARRLAAAVLAYASNIDRLHTLESAITGIGRKHVSLNVRPEQYPIIGKHLLGAIKTVLGDAATPEILDAWAAAYAQLADIMIAREKDLYIERNESREEISSSTGDKNEIANREIFSMNATSETKTATSRGADQEFEHLNKSSNEQIATLIRPLSSIQKENLVADMSSIKHMLRSVKPATLERNDVSIRTQLVPGDLGYIAWLHGKVYAEECGYLLNFEGYVLESMGKWAHQYDPAKDRVWVCEHIGRIVGFLAAVDHSDSLQLRYFLLLPEYRGIGLGKKLMDEFIAWMKFRRITKSYLWTTKEQHTAIALYKRYGYKLREEKPSWAFDKQLIEQRYDLEL